MTLSVTKAIRRQCHVKGIRFTQ